jgi:hypothetical protein
VTFLILLVLATLYALAFAYMPRMLRRWLRLTLLLFVVGFIVARWQGWLVQPAMTAGQLSSVALVNALVVAPLSLVFWFWLMRVIIREKA